VHEKEKMYCRKHVTNFQSCVLKKPKSGKMNARDGMKNVSDSVGKSRRRKATTNAQNMCKKTPVYVCTAEEPSSARNMLDVSETFQHVSTEAAPTQK
jgi:hypothetical protein